MSITKRLVAGVGALLVAGTLAAPAQAAVPDRRALQDSLQAVHQAGMYGLYSAVSDGRDTWKGAAGVADVRNRRPVKPHMVHRVGSITKTFTAVAVLQQVERGKVDLDAPVSRYLPDLISDDDITVRMLLNHTSHLADYIPGAFPSLLEGSLADLDNHRFRRIEPEELVRLGLAFPRTGEPGATPGSYSNTNYVLAGLVLEKVTGMDAERYITHHVIKKAGLRHTSFPRSPQIPGPSSGAYESFYGLFDPPRDYAVYDMSWLTTAGAVVSTMDDLNRFYRRLLQGELLGGAQLAEMQRTVPVYVGAGPIEYGLGIYALDLPCGRFWGHDGAVWGMLTQSLSSPDGTRQISVGLNRAKYQTFDENGMPVPHEIDLAFGNHLLLALCGPAQARTLSTPITPFPADGLQVKP